MKLRLKTNKYLFLFIFLLVFCNISSAYARVNKQGKKSINSPQANAYAQQFSLAPMLQKTMPSIVTISGIKRLEDKSHTPNSQNPEESVAMSIGSGIIVNSKKGHILTNAHVVNNLDEVWVSLKDKRKFDAKVIGVDTASDLALVEIPAIDTPAIKFADSDLLKVGDFVVAVGNPYRLEHTVTSGIISALSRTGMGMDGFYDLIQTDAAINMGNSGGGLLNYNGELVGINTIILSPQSNGGSVGLGFAIPANMAKSIYYQLAKTGHVDRGVFGVHVQFVNSSLAKAFGLSYTTGAIVTGTMPNSPAEKAGLNIGDVILAVDDKEVIDPAHLRTLVSLIQPGNSTKIKVMRDKQEQIIPVKITNPRDGYANAKNIAKEFEGLWLMDATPETAEVPGVLIMDIEPKSKAAKIELQKGDVLVAVNKQKINNIKELTKIAKDNATLLMQVIRDGETVFVAVNG